MSILLGIDTGGTYTDAVLFDDGEGGDDGEGSGATVLATAKALTSKHDLIVGVREAVGRVLGAVDDAVSPADIRMVGLSTTLATNALVEGHGQRICLLVVGQGREALQRQGLGQALGGDPVAFIAGGHNADGGVKTPLDENAVTQAVDRHASEVSAFAVAAYFATRNPAHEAAARALIRQRVDLPVTCSHDLTAALDAPRRALTTVFNARLIPMIRDLILAARRMMAEADIAAPLMVVRGDGSLIAADTALHRPVETILSGPAASVVGAQFLTGAQFPAGATGVISDMMVADMGGTTTDMALVHNGFPVLNAEGATVGGWRTLIQAVSVHTIGLGGDSEARIDPQQGLTLGPRRVMPLSLLATLHPETLPVLRDQANRDWPKSPDGRFAILLRQPANPDRLSRGERAILAALDRGPIALEALFTAGTLELPLDRLVERGLATLAGFTPSDASHVLGAQHGWDAQAALLGARLYARQPDSVNWRHPSDPHVFARMVVERMTKQVGEALIGAAVGNDGDPEFAPGQTLAHAWARRRLDPDAPPAVLAPRLTLNVPLVGIGAPAELYFPEAAQRLESQLLLPENGSVANAVGAVAGGVRQQMTATITPTEAGFRTHLPTGVSDHPTLDEAAEAASSALGDLAARQARDSGADDVELHVLRDDVIVEGEGGRKLFIESVIRATATGRPKLSAA